MTSGTAAEAGEGRTVPAKALLVCALAGVAALTYRDLLAFDPYASLPDGIDDSEGIFFSPSRGSPELAFVLAVWLAFRRRQRFLAGAASPLDQLLGFGLLGGALGLVVWAYYTTSLDILTPSLAIATAAVALVLSGRDGLRAIAMPLLFFALFATPWPSVLINAVAYPLQLATAQSATAILHALRVPVVASGDQIVAHDIVFHVIESCSGMRMISTLTMTTFVYAEVFHRSRARLLGLLVLAPFVGFLVNELRVVSLILGPASELVAAHTIQGLVMIVGGVILIASVDALIDRVRRDSASPERSSMRVDSTGDGWSLGLGVRGAVVALVLAAAALASVWVEPWAPVFERGRGSVHQISRQLGPWTSEKKPLEVARDFMGTTQFSQSTYRRYHRGEDTVDFFVGVNDRLLRARSSISPKTELPGSGWRVSSRGEARLGPDQLPVEALIVTSIHGDRQLVYHWRQNVRSLPSETLRVALALDRSPLRRADRARIFRLGTPLEPKPTGRLEASRRLEEFAHVALAAADDIEVPDESDRRPGVGRAPAPERPGEPLWHRGHARSYRLQAAEINRMLAEPRPFGARQQAIGNRREGSPKRILGQGLHRSVEPLRPGRSTPR